MKPRVTISLKEYDRLRGAASVVDEHNQVSASALGAFRAENVRLQTELAEKQTALDIAKECIGHMAADTALAGLVRAMPPGCLLINDVEHPATFPWEVHMPDGRRVAHDTPEAALRAAGITVPEPDTTEPDDL